VKKLILLLLLILSIQKVYAEDEFSTDYNITYAIDAKGSALVTNNIVLTNNQNDVIATTYSLTINQMNVSDVEASDSKGKLDVAKTENKDTTTITVDFNKEIIGAGRKNSFSVKFKTNDIASRVGNIWNISIPKIQTLSSDGSYAVTMTIPSELGPEIYVSPTPTEKNTKNGVTEYKFTKDTLSDKSISASFGKYQAVNFLLKYEVSNTSAFYTNKEIALPPDIVGRQQVSFKSFSQMPAKIYKDADGNYIASFRLQPKQSITIDVIGGARIFGKQINPQFGGQIGDLPKNIISDYTKEQKYWETSSALVKTTAKSVYDATKTVSQNAFELYKLVTTNLKYDFELSKKDFVERKGALSALQNATTDKVSCMEFTDTFIALARANGIPARELDGFAFVSDKTTTPLSIDLKGGDLLHSWAEYYDPNFGWVAVDPTWGTTSGIDYFTKLDTGHFAFAIKGKSSELPLPAGEYRFEYSSNKLISVDFSQNDNDKDFTTELQIEKLANLNIIDFFTHTVKYNVTNTGTIAVFNVQDSAKDLLPYQNTEIFLKNSATEVKYYDFNGIAFTKDITINRNTITDQLPLVIIGVVGALIFSVLVTIRKLRKRH